MHMLTYKTVHVCLQTHLSQLHPVKRPRRNDVLVTVSTPSTQVLISQESS